VSFVEAASIYEMPEGTMKAVEIKGKEILLANVGGTVYAVSERCGHMNAPLARGVLNGKIVTCPLHFSRFDVTSGKMVSGPVEVKAEGVDKLPAVFLKMAIYVAEMEALIRTHDLETFPVKVDGLKILVDI